MKHIVYVLAPMLLACSLVNLVSAQVFPGPSGRAGL